MTLQTFWWFSFPSVSGEFQRGRKRLEAFKVLDKLHAYIGEGSSRAFKLFLQKRYCCWLNLLEVTKVACACVSKSYNLNTSAELPKV